MRICLVSPLPPPYGGIAHWTVLLHRHVEVIKHQVQFLQLDTAPRWRAVDDVRISKRIIGGSIQFLGDFISFLKLLLLGRPDVVHLTSSGNLAVVRDILIGAATRFFRVPLVYHLHFGRVPEIAVAHTFEGRLMRTVMRMARVVVGITPQTLDAIRRFLPGIQAVYIPDPIDYSAVPTSCECRQNGKKALFLGWVRPTKGVSELVEAWSELAPVGWELLVVGPVSASYQANLVELYRPQNVRFLGELAHEAAMEVVAQCDLFVLPSHSEGFPNVILEAMGLGKAIIASSVGAIPDMLCEGSGCLITPKDVKGLKAAIADLIASEPLRRQLGQSAERRVRTCYDINTVFNRYSELWRQVRN